MRVVDCLELIEIDEQDSVTLTRDGVAGELLEAFDEKGAVGEVGQRVVMRHMRDARDRPLPIGDVLMRCDPAAIRHVAMRQHDVATIAQLLHFNAVVAKMFAVASHVGVGSVDRVHAVGDAHVQDFAQWRARRHLIAAQAVKLGVAAIMDDDAIIGVEHGESLTHMRQRHVKTQISLGKLARRGRETGLPLDQLAP